MESSFKDKLNPTMNELVKWFQIEFPEICDLMKTSGHSHCTQEPNSYHIEDTFWAHTMMVCLSAEFDDASKINKIVALLHDIGKPMVRGTEEFKEGFPNPPESNIKVHQRGHEGVSAILAIEVVNKLESLGVIDTEEGNSILKLISLHGVLFDRIKDEKEFKPEKVVNMFQNFEEYNNFISQVRYDSLGRFYDSERGRKNVAHLLGAEIYNEETYEKFYRPKPGRWDRDPECVIMVGVPNSGKSTYIKEHYPDHIVLSRDGILMEYGISHSFGETYNEIWQNLSKDDHQQIDKLFDSKLKLAFRNEENIVIDKTNLSDKSRRRHNIPKRYRTTAVVMMTGFNELYSRNFQRSVEGKTISSDVMLSMMKRFIVPTERDFDEVIYVR